MDWSKGKRTVTFNYKIRRVIATGSQAGRSTVGLGASRHTMSDAAGQQGSRLEVAPVLTVGHALLYPRVGYEPIGTLCIFVHSVVHR
jgi:hypothetical protein